MEKFNESQLIEAAGIMYLTPDNCTFQKNGDFLSMTKKADSDALYSRVNLHRMFPYDKPYSFISVLNSESEELGIIINIEDFPEDVTTMIISELDRKYYVCKLLSIISVKDRFGFSYWKTKGEHGEVTFTIKDAHSSIRLDGLGDIVITDIDGNRYSLPGLKKLDKKSRKLVELYL